MVRGDIVNFASVRAVARFLVFICYFTSCYFISLFIRLFIYLFSCIYLFLFSLADYSLIFIIDGWRTKKLGDMKKLGVTTIENFQLRGTLFKKLSNLSCRPAAHALYLLVVIIFFYTFFIL